VIQEVQDGEFIITTKQPFAKSHFFVDEELDTKVDETSLYMIGQTIRCPLDDMEETKTTCVVQVLDDDAKEESKTMQEAQIENLAKQIATKPSKGSKAKS
jgi:hypothetical protein